MTEFKQIGTPEGLDDEPPETPAILPPDPKEPQAPEGAPEPESDEDLDDPADPAAGAEISEHAAILTPA